MSIHIAITELGDWLCEQIDGGLECRGRDSIISTHIRTVEITSARIFALESEIAALKAELASARDDEARAIIDIIDSKYSVISMVEAIERRIAARKA